GLVGELADAHDVQAHLAVVYRRLCRASGTIELRLELVPQGHVSVSDREGSQPTLRPGEAIVSRWRTSRGPAGARSAPSAPGAGHGDAKSAPTGRVGARSKDRSQAGLGRGRRRRGLDGRRVDADLEPALVLVLELHDAVDEGEDRVVGA